MSWPGGVSKFSKARTDRTFQALALEAVDQLYSDLGISFSDATRLFDGMVPSYFSDHFLRHLKGGTMVHDTLFFCPKPSPGRLEAGGATGGQCFKEAVKEVASGDMDLCLRGGLRDHEHGEKPPRVMSSSPLHPTPFSTFRWGAIKTAITR